MTGRAAPVTQDGQYPDPMGPAAAGALALVALLLDGGELSAPVIRLRAGQIR